MNKLHRLFERFNRIISQDRKTQVLIVWNKLAPILPDRFFLQVKFYLRLRYWPDINNPRTLNEKLQWLKFYSKGHPEYTQMVDKVGAKDYVTKVIGKDYVIPTIGVWNSIDEIDWNTLPDKFVLKAAGDSGGLIICRDKSKLNVEDAKAKLKRCGEREYWIYNKEFPYQNVPHRYIAEELLEEEPGKSVKDYKIFCFNGEPHYLYLSQGLENHKTARMSFLDLDWQVSPFRRSDYTPFDSLPKQPENYPEMLDVARKLSKGLPHVRIDLYNINGRIYFGEMTFFTCSGMIPFEPREWDRKLGDLLILPDM